MGDNVFKYLWLEFNVIILISNMSEEA